MVDETVRRYGTVDILVNNAHGFGPRAPLEDIPEEQFDMSWRTGVKGTWWAMCAVLPLMRAKACGRIVNVGSLAAERGTCGARRVRGGEGRHRVAHARRRARVGTRRHHRQPASYPAAATKRGQDFAARDPERFKRLMDERPIGRLGDPEQDIAPVALFLASDDSRFLTGHVFYADGGAHLG